MCVRLIRALYIYNLWLTDTFTILWLKDTFDIVFVTYRHLFILFGDLQLITENGKGGETAQYLVIRLYTVHPVGAKNIKPELILIFFFWKW